MTQAVEIRDLHKTFASGRKALDAVSLTVGRGEMVALIGASGSGKSTLLRHIPGFLVADRGEVVVGGACVQSAGRRTPSVRRIRTGIGFVFQQFNLVERLPVITNVLVGQLHRMPGWRRFLMRFSIHERADAIRALTSVGIGETAWQRACTLSGGQQQRAAIARCLVQRARLILADEPIASLDPESSRRVMELLQTVNRVERCTVLVSLHQVEFAIRYCPRTIALRAGRVVYDGPSAALTPELLGDLYGSDVGDLFAPSGEPSGRTAAAPALATA